MRKKILLICTAFLLCAATGCSGNSPSVTEVSAAETAPASEDAAVSEEISAQLSLIAANASVWVQDASYGTVYQYTVTDLDQNGRLEVIAASLQGTGLYTYSCFFEVNEARDGLTAVTLPWEEYDAGPDIIVSAADVYYDSASQLYHYLFTDVTRNGAAESYTSENSLTLKDSVLENAVLARRSEVYSDEETSTVTCELADGTSITQEAYDSIADTTYGSLERRTASFSWYSASESTNLAAIDSDSNYDILLGCYQGFSLTTP